LRCEEAAATTPGEGSAVGKLSLEPSPRAQPEEEEEAFPIELFGRTLMEEEQLESNGAMRATMEREIRCRRMLRG
jgi:hypothetical protein